MPERFSAQSSLVTRAPQAGARVAVARRRHADGPGRFSPHLLDLKPKPGKAGSGFAGKSAAVAPPPSAPRGIFGILRHLLDERIHLHDLRVRTLSVRARGWKDFPPARATTLGQAVAITAKRFVNEHPLADLTVVSVAHLSVLLVWHVLVIPVRAARAAINAPRPERAPRLPALPLVMPVAAVPVAAPAQPVIRTETKPVPKLFPSTQAAPAPRKPPLPRWRLPRLQIQPGWQRSVLGFAATALVFVVPIGAASSLGSFKIDKNRVMERAVAAVTMLKVAGEAAATQDFGAARDAFSEAKGHFVLAEDELGAYSVMLNSASAIMPDDSILSAAGPLLIAGREMADGGERLASAMASMERAEDPAQKVRLLKMHLEEALPHLEIASKELSKVSPSAVPDDYRRYIETAKSEAPKLAAGVKKAVTVTDLLQRIMGSGEPRRYLVVFQNNAELRATGGFMGSFALVDVRDGKVRNMEIPGGGTYDLQGSLREHLRAPQPLHLVNPRWQFQDANWSPDFPTSAKKITWFYDKSGGPSTDGVIAITATFMEKLLGVIGPVEMPEYGKTITAQNFFYETQKEVEIDYDKAENKPKKFIADLAPKVIERIMKADRATTMKLAAILDDGLARKEMLFWFKDQETQQRVATLGWGGQMRPVAGDYLSIVHTNIAGQKTDLVMKDDVRHAVKVLPDGGAIVTLSISRTHTGQKGALFNGVRNVDYLRVYAPKGSSLVESRGFEPPDPKLFKMGAASDAADPAISEQERTAKTERGTGTRSWQEDDKTVFGNWVQTDPGGTSVVTLVYQLPPGTIAVHEPPDGRLARLYARLNDSDRRRLDYSLLVQKQPGANPSTFSTSVDLPRGYALGWHSPARKEDDRGRWASAMMLDRDASFHAMIETR